MQALRPVLDQQNKTKSLRAQIASRQKEVDAITKDQARLRENMKALKGSAEEKALLQRYTRQLDQQEDRLATLHKEIDSLQQQHNQAQEELENLIQSVNLDERL
jgi:predicted  nucleic acid-binding Zn-ribbon protein